MAACGIACRANMLWEIFGWRLPGWTGSTLNESLPCLILLVAVASDPLPVQSYPPWEIRTRPGVRYTDLLHPSPVLENDDLPVPHHTTRSVSPLPPALPGTIFLHYK